LKFIIFIIFFLSIIYSCNDNNAKQSVTNISQEKFDKTKWRTKDDNDYPYRDKMLNDLITNVKLKGLKKDEIIDLLGQPDRSDSSYLFYRIAQTRIGFFPLHTKTLVIKLTMDGTVEWRKIHE
jgi:hypothetical protein